jgi:hypothetical protein
MRSPGKPLPAMVRTYGWLLLWLRLAPNGHFTLLEMGLCGGVEG